MIRRLIFLLVTALSILHTPCLAQKLSLSSKLNKKNKWNDTRLDYTLKDQSGKEVTSFEDVKFMSEFTNPDFYLVGKGQGDAYRPAKYLGLVSAYTGEVVVPLTATHIEAYGTCIVHAQLSDRGGNLLIRSGKQPVVSKYQGVKISRPTYKEEWGVIAVKENEKWGFVDTCGNVLIEPRYRQADIPFNGIARVQDGDSWMLLDSKFKEIAGTRANYLSFKMGNFYAYNLNSSLDIYQKPQNGLYGIMDKDGNIVSKEIYQEIQSNGPGLRVKKDGQWLDLNPQLTAIATKPEVTKEFHKQTKWGYYKYGYKLGDVVLVKNKYDKAYDFYLGHAVVGNEGKDKIMTFGGNEARATEYGLINLAGKEVIEPKYKALWPYSESLYGFGVGRDYEQNWTYGIMDTTGRILVPAEYKRLGEIRDGLIAAQKQDRYGYIDLQGNTKISFKYKYAFAFMKGIACVADDDKKWYWIDASGNELMPGKRFASITDWDSTGRAWTWNAIDKWNRPDSAIQITRTGQVVATLPRNGPPQPPPPGRTRCTLCNGSGYAYKARDVNSSFTWTDGMFRPVETRTTTSYSYRVYEKNGACTRCGGDGYE